MFGKCICGVCAQHPPPQTNREDTTTDNNLATRNSEELVVPDHNDFVVPEDANVTAEDAEMPGDDTKTEELPAQVLALQELVCV